MKTALALLLGSLIASPAAAHPLDEVVQGAYLTLAPGEVRLQLDIEPGPMVSGGLRVALDSDGDRIFSEAEGRAYAMHVLQQSGLVLDGAPVSWKLVGVDVPPYRNLALGETLKIRAVALRTDAAGPHLLSYRNGYTPAKSQCIANIFVAPPDGWAYRIVGQQHSEDGRGLTVSYAAGRP